jgi:hypothetical protein
MATWGMTDGSARDPDRVTGNADRPRSRRASARRTEAAKDPFQGYSLALIDGPASSGAVDRTTEYRIADRRSPSSSRQSTTDSNEATPTPPPGVASSYPAHPHASAACRRRHEPDCYFRGGNVSKRAERTLVERDRAAGSTSIFTISRLVTDQAQEDEWG